MKNDDVSYQEYEQALEKKYAYIQDFLEKSLANTPGLKPEIPFFIARSQAEGNPDGIKNVNIIQIVKLRLTISLFRR